MPAKLPKILDVRSRLTAIVLLVLLIGLALFFGSRYRDFQSAVPRGGNLFVFFLININVLLVTVLIFLLARNVIKLFYEGRRKVFGYHLRAKLVLILAGFSLIPTILLLFVAEGFISDSVRYWFNINVEQAVEDSVSISRDYYSTMTGRARVLAQRVSDRLGEIDGEKDIGDRLEAVRKDYSVSDIELFDHYGQRIADAWDGLGPQEVTDPQSSLVQNASVGRVVDGIGKAMKGEFIKGAAPLMTPRGQGAVIVSIFVPENVRAKAENIAKTYRGYTEMKLLKKPIYTNYRAYLIFLAMLILFSASWLGFYIARSITVPIQSLAEGAEKVAGGDLSVRVDVTATDEIGILVQAFNRMTGELEEGRLRLEKAHGDLEKAYFENEQRRTYIETVLRDVGTGVVSMDMEGRINTFNRAAEVMFVVNPEDVLGRCIDDLLGAEHVRVMRGMLKAALDSDLRNVRREIPIVVAGTPLILRLNISVLDDPAGKPMGFVLVLEDMTQLVNAQKKAAWSEVATRIAHEIKNPLTPIKLSAERIRKRLMGHLDEEDARIMSEGTASIIREVDWMRSLVNEFSQFARLPVLTSVPGDINGTISEVTALYSGGKSMKMKIGMQLEPDLPVISFDHEQIRRVLINLIDNAIKAVEEKGEGEILVSTNLLRTHGILEISVADTGVGVRENLRNRIFEPYFSTREDGSGLGLAITQRIVEEHGGTITHMENHPSGSVFSVRIPVDIDPGRRA
ncbi:MAG TPA: HAMP domain-containing protein [Proteobacteria bacterium]|nr:alginate biosynthesis sensor protein KinB [bacterium BMS3Abin14]HDL52507.1 HAMP domain-containing protein [Pseudomonadota bacterium]